MWEMQWALQIWFLEREKERLFSRFLDDPTVGIHRDKKESGSTQRGLRVGASFEEFRQTL